MTDLQIKLGKDWHQNCNWCGCWLEDCDCLLLIMIHPLMPLRTSWMKEQKEMLYYWMFESNVASSILRHWAIGTFQPSLWSTETLCTTHNKYTYTADMDTNHRPYKTSDWCLVFCFFPVYWVLFYRSTTLVQIVFNLIFKIGSSSKLQQVPEVQRCTTLQLCLFLSVPMWSRLVLKLFR